MTDVETALLKEGDVLITVYTHNIEGRYINMVLSDDAFLDEATEMIGEAVIGARKVMAKDRPYPPKEALI